MKEKKVERLQLRLTEESMRRLRVICGHYGCKMSELICKLIDYTYFDQISLWDSELVSVADEICEKRYNNEIV